MTAPIGSNESVVMETGGGTIYSASYVEISTTTYTIVTNFWPEGTSGSGLTTVTGYGVNSDGIQTPWTQKWVPQVISGPETSVVLSESTYLTTTAPAWTSTYTESVVPGYLEEFSWTPITPCCGECTLFAGDVEVYYWPTTTQSLPVSKLVNSADFTFTSPSVYVAFLSLYATNWCSTLGPDVDATTLAFPVGEISTAKGYYWNTEDYTSKQPLLAPVYTEATFGAPVVCTDVTESFYQEWGQNSGLTYINYYGTETYSTLPSWWGGSSSLYYHYTVTYNPCLPSISVPSKLFTLYPEWKTCSQGIPGLYDPLYVLSTGNGLAAFTTAADPVPNAAATTKSELAVAVPTIAAPTPTATETAEQADPSPSPSDEAPTNLGDLPASPTVAGDPAVPSSDSSATTSVDPTPAIITIGSSTLTVDSSSAFVLGSQTLTAGGQITHSGTVLSLDPSATAVVIGGTTQTLSLSTKASPYIIGTQILSTGGAVVTVSGTTYSLQSDGSSVLINGTPQPLIPTSEYIIASQTLIAGGSAIRVSGTTYSLQGDGSSVLVNGAPQPLTTPEYIFASQTLVAGGPAITVSGTEISLQAGGSSVVVGGQAEALSVLLGTSTTEALGGVIASIGRFETPAMTGTSSGALPLGSVGYNGTVFLGGASRDRRKRSVYATGVMLGLYVLVVGWLQ